MSEMDDIVARLAAETPAIERIETSFGPYWMQSISGEQHWHFMKVQEDLMARGAKTIPPAFVVAVALCKPDGSPLHEELSDTMALVNRMKRERIYELHDHALRVTGLGIRAVEEAEKKSSSSQSSESGTNSPSSSEAAP